MNDVTPPRHVVTILPILTRQERRVLRASLNYRPVPEIARELVLSPYTIKSHRYTALGKWLVVTNQTKGGQRALREMIQQVAPFLPPEEQEVASS